MFPSTSTMVPYQTPQPGRVLGFILPFPSTRASWLLLCWAKASGPFKTSCLEFKQKTPYQANNTWVFLAFSQFITSCGWLLQWVDLVIPSVVTGLHAPLQTVAAIISCFLARYWHKCSIVKSQQTIPEEPYDIHQQFRDDSLYPPPPGNPSGSKLLWLQCLLDTAHFLSGSRCEEGPLRQLLQLLSGKLVLLVKQNTLGWFDKIHFP